MSRIALFVAAAFAAAALLVPAAMASASSPVVVINSAKFGKVLATPGHLAFYTWNREKDHKVHCTGACAKVWPPITVAKGAKVPTHVKGAMGMFGTIARPDGARQLTFEGRPLYTFHGDTATKILCNGVDGWFVVKA